MPAAILSESSARIMERYDHFHKIMSRFQLKICDGLNRNQIKEAAKALGVWRSGAVMMDDTCDIAVLLDFAIYGRVDANERSIVVNYARAHAAQTSSDEELVLNAMAQARYCLYQVTKRLPQVGVECYDLLRKRHLLLANHGFGATAQEGAVFAGRLVSVPGFEISTGAALPVDAETFAYINEQFTGVLRRIGLPAAAFEDPRVMEAMSSFIISACISGENTLRILRLNVDGDVRPEAPLSRALPAENISRNRPCPCGSGLKYKRCCGELARR